MNTELPKDFLDVVSGGEFVVLDTETTGLRNAQVIQIAVVNADGDTLLNTLVKPTCEITPQATAVHRLTAETLRDAPAWDEIAPQVLEAIKVRRVMIYNARFDIGCMDVSNLASQYSHWSWLKQARYFDVMSLMAPIVGKWSDYHHNYQWPSLSKSLSFYKLPPTNDHTALADALATLALIRRMVE